MTYFSKDNQDKLPLTEQEEQAIVKRIKSHLPPEPSPQFNEKLRQKLKQSVLKRRRKTLFLKWGTGVAVALICLLFITPFGKGLLQDSITFVSSFFQNEEEKPVVIPEFPQEHPREDDTSNVTDETLVPVIAELEEVIASHSYLQNMRFLLSQSIEIGTIEGTPEYQMASRSFTYYHAALALKDYDLIKKFTWGPDSIHERDDYNKLIQFYHEQIKRETLEIVSITPSMAEPDFWIAMRYQDQQGQWFVTDYILSLSYYPSPYNVLDQILSNSIAVDFKYDEDQVIFFGEQMLETRDGTFLAPTLLGVEGRTLTDAQIEGFNQALKDTLAKALIRPMEIQADNEEQGDINAGYYILHQSYPYISLNYSSSITFPTVNQGREIGFNTYLLYDLEANKLWTTENILKEISLPVLEEDDFSFEYRFYHYFNYLFQAALEKHSERYVDGYLKEPASFTLNDINQVYLDQGEVHFYHGDYIYGTHLPTVVKLHELKHVLLDEEFLRKLK